MKKKWRDLNLFHKFTMAIITVGLIPMAILVTFISNSMIEVYRDALKNQYTQAAEYLSSSLERMLDSYNTISQIPYYYTPDYDNIVKNYLAYDNLRQIFQDVQEPERELSMELFLKHVENVDGSLLATHFIGVDGAQRRQAFHYSSYNTYFVGEELLEEAVAYEELDTESNQLILIPPHGMDYYKSRELCFTIARNYFDLRGPVGNTPYVGTIFLDISMERFEQMFQSASLGGRETVYVLNEEGDCFYSNDREAVGTNVSETVLKLKDTKERMVLKQEPDDYGIRVLVVMNTEIAFEKIWKIQRLMYLFLAASVGALLFFSVLFSRRLTRPIHAMMEQMGQVESGRFDIHLPVESGDEIGVLSRRFNQMSVALKNYIDQSYLAQIRQTEAELVALKSQIYPHFLYNTLEIIRMTALENEGGRVAEMIEALSEQIHYLIGPVKDFVPLEKEIDIVKKYVYLLNCRISGKVQLVVEAPEASELMIPKLILQPLVENAYVHGIRPKNGRGSILIEAHLDGETLELSVMDNGVGMTGAELEQVKELLEGDEPGIKNEYNWQSIGLKNVHDRIRYLFGEKYGIEITGTPGVGTSVTVRMPQRNREKRHDKDDIGG